MHTASLQDSAQSKRFGTFGRALTPCTLTIPGVIMFRRFDFLVGHAGVITDVLIFNISDGMDLEN